MWLPADVEAGCFWHGGTGTQNPWPATEDSALKSRDNHKALVWLVS